MTVTKELSAVDVNDVDMNMDMDMNMNMDMQRN